MNKFVIDEEQLRRLKNIAVMLRTAASSDEATLSQVGYDIESVIAEVETSPIDPTDEEKYGEQSEDDDEEPSGGSEEDL